MKGSLSLAITAAVVAVGIQLRGFGPARPLPPPTGVVIVTGASSGIGLASAIRLADNGFNVLAGVRKNADAERLGQLHTNLRPVLLDVVDEARLNELQVEVRSTGLPLWAVVNNAGVGYPMPVELVDLGRAAEVFHVNVLGVIRMVKAFAPLLRESRGRIVNVGSATGTLAAQCDGVYAASKHALEGLTDSLRLELSPWDISVSLVIPGQVKSSMWGKLTGDNSPARRELSAEQYGLYRPLFEQVDRAVAGFQSLLSDPECVTSAILHAVTSRYPRTRYVVASLNGVPLWLIRPLVKLVPDALLDRIKLAV